MKFALLGLTLWQNASKLHIIGRHTAWRGQHSKCSDIDSAFSFIKLKSMCFFYAPLTHITLTDREIKAEPQ